MKYISKSITDFTQRIVSSANGFTVILSTIILFMIWTFVYCMINSKGLAPDRIMLIFILCMVVIVPCCLGIRYTLYREPQKFNHIVAQIEFDIPNSNMVLKTPHLIYLWGKVRYNSITRSVPISGFGYDIISSQWLNFNNPIHERIIIYINGEEFYIIPYFFNEYMDIRQLMIDKCIRVS